MESLDSLLFGEEVPQVKEPVEPLIRSLSSSCRNCRLHETNPDNPGFLWKGNPKATVAILSDYPSFTDMNSREAFADMDGMILRDWLDVFGLAESETFMTYVVQCRTPNVVDKAGVSEPRDPADDEFRVCFPSRALRVIQALPNLEVLVCVGITAMNAALGGMPQIKSFQGVWFGTSMLPGVAVFCLPHMREFGPECSPRKKGWLLQTLGYFRNEYTGTPHFAPGKILRILETREKERKC